ncbi:MAG TPA: DUF917 domain-containing protein [Pseudonocardia sp.]|jgi:hypothetical protein|nr:DUF917 domain-containing protein [Pseudonocardia sp.]
MAHPPLSSLDVEDLDELALGCAIFGTGGGGEIETGLLGARRAVREHGPVPLVSLCDLPDGGLILPLSGVGAPTVGSEMLLGDSEPHLIRRTVEETVGASVVAVMCCEIGGSNGVSSVGWAAQLGLPLIDGDGIGRAFPELSMTTMNVAGIPETIAVIADVLGNVTVIRPVTAAWAETIARSVAVAAGSFVLMADYILPAARLRGAIVTGSVSRALRVGRVLPGADDPVAELITELAAVRLVAGRVVAVERRTEGGFVRGSVVVEGSAADAGRLLRIEVQNENLVAFEDGEVRASVPDLITVVDSTTAQAIATESVRYGQRVCVLAWPCDPIWRTAEGLRIAGPRAFGYDLDFAGVEELASARV